MPNAFDVEDTIAAIATARAPGASRGIVRVSGPDAISIVANCCSQSSKLLAVRSAVAITVDLIVPNIPPLVTRLLVWPTAKSYTRQPSVEIHTFGSLPVLDAVLDALTCSGARLAQPGEFTMRAFLSGRLDLTEAEAVLGVIDAQEESQLKVALQQLAGGLAKPLEAVRAGLIETLAHLEAGLDFVEEDIEFISAEELVDRIDTTIAACTELENQLQFRADPGQVPKVVLTGSPNAGKSSLFNELGAGEKQKAQAIVSEVSGTTRDYLTQTIRDKSLTWLLVDTAGVEDSPEGAILAEGQSRSLQMKSEADLEILCIDGAGGLNPWEQHQLATLDERRVICVTKSDLSNDANLGTGLESAIRTSVETGEGIHLLKNTIARRLLECQNSESVPGTVLRCQQTIRKAQESLGRARATAVAEMGDELVAAEMRGALEAIGMVTGVVYTDDILDVVFGQFCIGK